MDNQRSIVSKRHDYGEDCTSCRLVSGGGIIGMGIFVLSSAKQQKTPLNRNFGIIISLGKCKRSKSNEKMNTIMVFFYKYVYFFGFSFCCYLLTLGIIGIGAARLLALPPFQRTISE